MTRRKRTAKGRSGFTLIELLVVVAVIGIMVTVGVVSITSGQGAVRVKGATRDIVAAIRGARSTALVTQKPAVITYSTGEVDGEVTADVTVTTAKLIDSSIDRSNVETFTGEIPKWQKDAGKHELVHIRGKESKSSDGEGGEEEQKSEGKSLEDIIFEPISSEVVKGMRLKVEMGDKYDSVATEEVRKSKISVFSNVDYILGRFNEKQKSQTDKKDESKTSGGKKSDGAALSEKQEPVSVVWETNGRVDPHMVWIYSDGQKPEDGLLVKVDRFGAVKVLSGDGREDDR